MKPVRAGVDRLHRADRGAEDGAQGDIAGDDRHEDQEGPETPARRRGDEGDRGDDRNDDQERQGQPASSGAERLHDGRVGDDDGGGAAQRGKAHHAGIEQAGIAPLQVQPHRHDRRDQAHVEDGQRDGGRLEHAGGDEGQTHGGKGQRRAPGRRLALDDRVDRLVGIGGCGLFGGIDGRVGHLITAPLKMPVGRISKTTTRMMNETANL